MSGHAGGVRLFSSALASQAVLSAANLGVGLLLIRNTSDAQYGAYILAYTVVLLALSLQNAFFAPQMVARMTPLGREGRGAVVGGMHREQQRILRPLAACSATLIALLWALGVIDRMPALIALAAVIAAVAALTREFFRVAMLAYRRAGDVLRADAGYVAILVIGVVAATWSPTPAISAVMALAIASLCGAILLWRSMRRGQAWDPKGVPGVLREIAPLAAWSTAGAAIHWTFSQGYTYLVAGVLDVASVASLAATRLLLTPVVLLSVGIGSVMLTLACGWLQDHGPAFVFRRLLRFAAAVGAAALLYIGALWLLREPVYTELLQKDFAQRDALLALWGAIALLMVVRDQLIFLPVALQRFRHLTWLAATVAVTSLTVSFVMMQYLGVIGALIGILSGEIISLSGVLWISLTVVSEGKAPVLTRGERIAAESGMTLSVALDGSVASPDGQAMTTGRNVPGTPAASAAAACSAAAVSAAASVSTNAATAAAAAAATAIAIAEPLAATLSATPETSGRVVT